MLRLTALFLFDEVIVTKDQSQTCHMGIADFSALCYQQEFLDNLEAEKEVHGHYNNLFVAVKGAHTIILTSRKYTGIGNFWTCLFYLGEILSGEEVA